MSAVLVQEALQGRFGPSDQDKPAWLAARRQGVTATEVRDLWLGKITIAQLVDLKLGRRVSNFAGNIYTRWGTEREPVIAQAALEHYGIEPESRLVRSEDDPRKLASPDGIGFDFDGALLVDELKTSGKPIPLHSDLFVEKGYDAQMTWVMRVTGARRCLFGWEIREPDLMGGFVPGELTFEWYEFDEAFAVELEQIADTFLAALAAAANEPFVMPEVDEELDTHAVNYLRFIADEKAAGEAKKGEYDAILASVGERESFQQEGASARITLTPMKVGSRTEIDLEQAKLGDPQLWADVQEAQKAWDEHAVLYEREIPTESKPRITITAVKATKETKA